MPVKKRHSKGDQHKRWRPVEGENQEGGKPLNEKTTKWEKHLRENE